MQRAQLLFNMQNKGRSAIQVLGQLSRYNEGELLIFREHQSLHNNHVELKKRKRLVLRIVVAWIIPHCLGRNGNNSAQSVLPCIPSDIWTSK